MTKLYTPDSGTTEAFVLGVLYKVKDGIADVSHEAAKIMTESFGFTEKIPAEIKNVETGVATEVKKIIAAFTPAKKG